ncbi:MAG: hypothetical protein IJ769_12195, partial [Clostridia bacterium]|nr:hypothetical protein [Clostridia bacterium]
MKRRLVAWLCALTMLMMNFSVPATALADETLAPSVEATAEQSVDGQSEEAEPSEEDAAEQSADAQAQEAEQAPASESEAEAPVQDPVNDSSADGQST